MDSDFSDASDQDAAGLVVGGASSTISGMWNGKKGALPKRSAHWLVEGIGWSGPNLSGRDAGIWGSSVF